MNGKILLVDDERDIVDLMEDALRRDGFTRIRRAYTGAEAVSLCRAFEPDVMVLDVMLPDIDGLEVCRQVRAFSYCSILFLSARSDDVDKILGLSSGGDDYIAKPFSPRETVYRIKAQLRRQRYPARPTGATLSAGPIAVDLEGSRAYKDGVELRLTGREFLLLAYMVEHADKIISKERLYERVWGTYSGVCDNTIMVHIRHIREKIEADPSDPKQLITVKGLGYKLRKELVK